MTVLRKSRYIALVLILGLYYNSAPIARVSYSTFAESAFAANCVNPGKPDCNGKCQVISITDKAEKSNKSQTPTLQIAQVQPSLLFSTIVPDLSKVGKKILFFHQTPRFLSSIPHSPFHPPRISA